MAEIEVASQANQTQTSLNSDHYEAIIQAYGYGQLWPSKGHFYPDCSALQRQWLVDRLEGSI